MPTTAKGERRISKRTVMIASILTVLIGVPLAIYLITKDASTPYATWYNSSWNYRRSVTITSTHGSTLYNEDVLITVDTATLITASKLQADCGDLRFVDDNDVTVHTYWIEGGCNTATTQVWVRIPELPNGESIIYMYYDNSTVANGEESWSGNFISLSDQASCATDWTRISALDSRFPRGSTTYGSTAGASTHSHSASGSTNSAGGTTTVQGGASWGGPVSKNGAHTHSVTVNLTSDVNHIPPYVNMLYCGKSKLDILANHITLFDVASFTGWTRYTALDAKFPQGASASIGGTGGSNTHTHTVSFSLGTAGGAEWMGTTCSSNCHYPINDNHTHSASATTTTETSNNIPAYLDMVFMKKDSTGTLSTERPIYMLNTATMPPYGWERFTTLDDKFPRGSASYGGIGGSDSHIHSGSRATGTVSPTYSALWYESGNFNATTNHSHTITWSAVSSNNLPPYLTTVFAKRKTSQSTEVSFTEETENATPTAPTSQLTEGATNPTKVTDITPEFSAIFNDPDTSDTSSNYEIEVNTLENFTGTVMWDSGKSGMTETNKGDRSPDISYNGSTLSVTVTYYWRIKFWDASDAESPWSAIANFDLNQTPTAPTSQLTEGATNPTNITDTTPEFSAIFNDPDTSDTSSNYEIEVNTLENFTGTVMWDSGKSGMTETNKGDRSPDTSYNGTTLSLNGTTYYWRIRLWDSQDAESPWSAVAQFITVLDTDDKVNNLEVEPLRDGDPPVHFQIGGIKLEGITIN